MGNWVAIGPAGTRGYLAVPESGSGPGLLVLHAWWGLTSAFTDICDQLAAEGYVALAPSLYASGATAETIAEAEALMSSHDEGTESKAIALAATDQLLSLPAVSGSKIGVIGYSMGAYWALQLSQLRPENVSAAVTVYGTSDGDFGAAKAAYLGHFAEHDDYEPLEGVRALEEQIRDAGCEVAFFIYPGTSHWFVEPNQPNAYNAEAAQLAWDRTLAFLRAKLA
ncbi:MAG TPA: dienelactone hydrolase family protein [Thermomicrobiales bacterium]|nr:dienelactone hydrolase family protein [Thermomicrobiales bacterium]